MPASEDEEPPAEVDPAYLAFFSESANDFRSHLSGRDDHDPPPASYFAPRSHWNSAEKDAFFRGLAVHSRLRPDLIAEEIKTKTVPDVCVYLAILEQRGRELLDGTTYINEPNRASGTRCPRRDLPAAVEVSEEWIAFEDRMADAMIALQPVWDQQPVIQAREDEVQKRRNALRAAKGPANPTSKVRDREGQKLRREEFDNWLVEKTSVWEGEDLLSSLDHIKLTTLDRMLRDGQEGRGGVDEAVGYDFEEDSAPVRETEDVQSVDEQRSSVAHTVGIDDQLIDPVLLAISQPSSSFSPALGEPGPPRTSGSSVPNPSSSLSQPTVPSTPPAISRSLPTSPPLSFHTTPATTAVPSVGSNEGSVGDLSQLSPGTRRRYQKRLYMRKKRAQANGAVVVEAVERLKPGRKPKKAASVDSLRAQATIDVPSSPSTPGEALHLDGPSSSQDGHHAAQSARKSTDNKRRTEFASQGIDGQRLRREGFDLFHLQGISKLMQTYNSLHDVPESVGSAISGATLSALHALVVNFVAEVMSRAIVWREQERVAKLQTKAWRLRENQVISRPNVKQALMLYGAECLDKNAHFARLTKKLGLDEDEDEVIDEGLPDGATSHQTDNEEEALEENGDDADEIPFEPLSLLRTVFPPLSNPLSRAPKDASTAVDPSVYLPLPPVGCIYGEPSSDEDLLPETLDEKLLVDELLEERQLEKWDRHHDIEGEKALWARVNTKNPHPNLAADTVDSDLEDLGVPDEPPEAVAIPEQPQRKPKRKEAEASALRSKDVEGGNAGERNKATTVDAPIDVDEPEVSAPKRRRVAGKGGLSQKSLLYMEPGANSRIKSSVYVLDSD
ncbi:transcription factor [Ganoderma sinense ZZ0214-1]|uniref:Transcription factor n=1 Tax=Ganoderma sinense ZZ0214-1 TaxID=1077348 RepID=A0A2G8RMB1_9APHY|nr:transcription factor [Ganoderma sinense ZZ0214-1]